MAKTPEDLLDDEDPDIDTALADPDEGKSSELDESLLSEEERAALKEGDSEPDTYDPDDPDAEPVIDPKTGVLPPVKAEPAATPATAPVAEQLPPVIPERVDRTAELADLATKEAALQSLFDDGEISDTDYKAQIKAIAKDQGRYEDEQNARAEAIKTAKASGDAAFLAAVTAVKTATPGLFGPEHLPGYNRFVELVTADPKNAKMTFTQQLEKAQTLYALDVGDPALAPLTAKNPAPKAKAADPAAKPEPIRAEPIPTLARIPAAATNDTDGDRWQALNRLLDQGKIEQHERALARMTKDQREAYGAFEG
jgi:hypothetical protein